MTGARPTPSLPRLDGLLEVSLYVEDMDRSAAFYRDLLGFEVVATHERLRALGAGGRQVLLLFERGASARLEKGAHDASGRQHLAFAVPAAELEAWTARLSERGVEVEETIRWPRGGTSVYFRDPDGHLIELATPGVWSVY
jgi:catechol 2,3-dioxygenase-like lactoylglutathione lyase family enzyme